MPGPCGSAEATGEAGRQPRQLSSSLLRPQTILLTTSSLSAQDNRTLRARSKTAISAARLLPSQNSLAESPLLAPHYRALNGATILLPSYRLHCPEALLGRSKQHLSCGGQAAVTPGQPSDVYSDPLFLLPSCPSPSAFISICDPFLCR